MYNASLPFVDVCILSRWEDAIIFLKVTTDLQVIEDVKVPFEHFTHYMICRENVKLCTILKPFVGVHIVQKRETSCYP
jgi:hypothetical protein